MFDGALPALVFVVVNAVASLRTGVVAALACGVAVAAARLVRRQPVQQALSGLVGLAFAAALALRTRDARNFFAPGILINLAYGLAFVGSAALRRPLVGFFVSVIGGGQWATESGPRLRRTYVAASFGWGAMFLLKFAVQGLLYLADRPGWLAVARLGMGWPLYLVAGGLTAVAVRRAHAADAQHRVVVDPPAGLSPERPAPGWTGAPDPST